jgi:hypothetical protein
MIELHTLLALVAPAFDEVTMTVQHDVLKALKPRVGKIARLDVRAGKTHEQPPL